MQVTIQIIQSKKTEEDNAIKYDIWYDLAVEINRVNFSFKNEYATASIIPPGESAISTTTETINIFLKTSKNLKNQSFYTHIITQIKDGIRKYLKDQR